MQKNNVITSTNVFEKFIWVSTNITIYGGQISLGKTALKSQDYPKDLVTEGGLKLVQPSKFNPVEVFRARARAILVEVGHPFLGGVAISVEKWPEVQSKLDHCKVGFTNEVDAFANSWAANVHEWADSHEHQRDTIINSAPPAEVVRNRFDFTYSAVHFQPIAGAESGLEKQIHGLEADIYADIAKQAESAVKNYESNKSQITRKMRSRIEAIIMKLKCLAFVSPKLEVTANAINDFFTSIVLPKSGGLPKETQAKIAILLVAMKNPENLPDLATALSVQEEKAKMSWASINNEKQIPANTTVTESKKSEPVTPGETQTNSQEKVDYSAMKNPAASMLIGDTKKNTEAVTPEQDQLEQNVSFHKPKQTPITTPGSLGFNFG